MHRRWVTRCVVAALTLLAAACSGTAGESAPAAAPSSPAREESASLDAWARSVAAVAGPNVAAGATPGLVIVLADDRGSRTVALGLADRDAGTPMTPDALFRISGITAPMVAGVVLQLVDEGALDLQDTVERWRPGLLAHGDEITVAQLLGHTSGLPEADLGSFVGRGGVTEEDLVRDVAERPLEFPPGSQLVYRDVDFVVVGLVAQRAAGRPLVRMVRERLFEPLGMGSALFAREGVVPPGMAHGYNGPDDVTHLDVYWGDAAFGVTADAADTSRFLRGLLTGAVLPEDQLEAMTDLREDNLGSWTGYGLGLARTATDCGEALGHAGRFPGYASEAWFDPETSRSVVMMANVADRAVLGTFDVVLEAALCG